MLELRKVQLLLLVVHGTMSTYFPCYVHFTDVLATPLNHFKLPPGNQCWDYCRYHDECKAYLVQLDDLSLCSLYEKDLDKLDQVQNLTSRNIVGWKRCLLGLMGPELYLSNGQQWIDMASKEVVIQKIENGFCISVDLAEADKMEPDASGFPLLWSSTCDKTFSWEFPIMQTVGNDNEHIGCKMVVIRLKGTQMCLTSVFRNPPYSVPQAFLKRCKDDTETESSNSVLEMGAENQHLVLCPEKIENAWSLMLFRTYHPRFRPITLSTDDMDKDPILTLWNISLPAPSTPVQVSACKHVEAENGTVEIGEGVPLFLPGEKITVRCNEGFGVEVDHVIRREYVTSCSEEMELDLCAPTLPVKDQQSCNQSGSQGIYFSIIEVWFVFCFVFN